MGIQINGTTDTISAVDGTLDINQHATFGGNVTIGGTITYEDATSIDSVGIITARDDIKLTKAEGQIEATGSTGLTLNASHGSAYARIRTAGSERFRIGTGGQIGLSGANYGSSGQVLTSQGSGSAAAWSTVSGTTINNNANNRVITGSGTANTLEGEANLQWDGETLYINRSSNTIEGLSISNSNNSQGSAAAQINLSGGDNSYSNIRLECNGAIHHIRQDGSGNLKFYNNTTERLRIDSSGRLGIGDASPSVIVSIKDTAPKIKFIDSDATGTPETLVDASGGDLILDIDKDNEKGSTLFAVKIDGSEKARITSGGKFIQGATSTNTNTIHHVEGSAASGAEFIGNNSAEGFYLALQNKNTNTNAYTAIQSWDAGGQIVASQRFIQVNNSNNQGAIAFRTRHTGSSEAERMRIHSTGQIRIGDPTGSPQTNFDVVRNSASTLTDVMLVKGNTGNGFIRFQDDNNSCNWTLGVDDGSGIGANAFILYDRVNSAYRWSVDNGGNMKMWSGNIQMASGQGIDFGATGDGSGSGNRSEVLDDYEQGSFTPVMKVEGQSNAASTLARGLYVKVGGMVTVWIEFIFDGTPSNRTTGNAWEFHSLPFLTQNDSATPQGLSDYRAPCIVIDADTSGTYGSNGHFVARNNDNSASGRIEWQHSDLSLKNASLHIQNGTYVQLHMIYPTTI